MGKSALRLITLEIFKIISDELVQEFGPAKTGPHPIIFFQISANVISTIVYAAFTGYNVRGNYLRNQEPLSAVTRNTALTFGNPAKIS